MTNLKPCPFCGGEAELRVYTPTMQFVQCKDCGATSCTTTSGTETIAAWNRRYTVLSRLKARLISWLQNGSPALSVDTTIPAFYSRFPDLNTDWVVRCRFCYAAVPNCDTPEQAAAAWNMRACPDIDENKIAAEMLRAWTREMIHDLALSEVQNALAELTKEN